MARPALRGARPALYGLFASFGILLSTWAVHLPGLKQAVGMSASTMGTMLLVLGVGSLVGMQVAGVLVDRFGGEGVALTGSAAMAVTMLVPLAAHTLMHAVLGALLFGVMAGAADVSVNAVAVDVQRDGERPIMASFHGTYSGGTVVGALLGAGGFAVGLDGMPVALAVSSTCLVVVAAAAVGLRGRRARSRWVADSGSQATPQEGRSQRLRIVFLGVLAFFLFLSEGSAMDWASLHAQQHLGASPSAGAFVVASFLVAMTLSRLTIDRVTARVGPVRVLRAGSLVAATGMVVVVVATSLPVLTCGWIVFGLGLAVGAPQVFTAAGNVFGVRAGRNLSRVVGAGYVAILAGPAITGWLIELVSWTGALLVPLAAVTACALGASAVRARLPLDTSAPKNG